MARSELPRRFAVAAIGIPVAAAAIYTGGWLLAALLMLVCAGSAVEFYRLAKRAGIRAFTALGAFGAAGFVAATTVAPQPAGSAQLAGAWLLALILATAAAAVPARGVDGRPLEAGAVTVFGAVYTGATLSLAMLLRHHPAAAGAPDAAWAGIALVAFPVVLTWVNDTAAYFVGRRWGRRRLSPRVSPSKTVEGAAGALAGTVLVGGGYAALVFDAWAGLPVSAGAGALGGLLISVAAQIGDLVESVWKREAGVKDSGILLPGHGGLLDRVDALFFTVPVAYLYFALLLPAGSAWP